MVKIVVVDKNNKIIGSEEKRVALEKEMIRRVSRIFIFNKNKELFLQKRAPNKKIAPNAWDVSVGGHVDENETYLKAAKRELKEELGIVGLKLKKVCSFYLEEPSENKTAKAFDELYKTEYSGEFVLNKAEIVNGKWFSLNKLEKEIKNHPNKFAPGLKKSFEEYKKISFK
ncbi:NUDIX domain-containing protein [archaeon]|nr:NUDIX domain-containing protein [archaeon]